MAARSYFAGVDVGGTTVTTQLVAQLVDGQLRPVHETTVATDISSPDATLESIAHGIDLTLREAGGSGAAGRHRAGRARPGRFP